MADIDRYLKIMRWLRKRYCGKDGYITVSVGWKQTPYTVLERGFFKRYCC